MSDVIAVSPATAAKMLFAADIQDIDGAMAMLKPFARFDGAPYYKATAVSRLAVQLHRKGL